jgi:uncharacterized protein (TIGR00251 family)
MAEPIEPITRQLKEKIFTGQSLLLNVHVTPKSRTNQFLKLEQDSSGKLTLKAKIHGIPENGQVNLELIRFLSSQLNLSPGKIKIISGFTSRHKIISISA